MGSQKEIRTFRSGLTLIFYAVCMLGPQCAAFAQTCETYHWPTIGVIWEFPEDTDDYYVSKNYPNAGAAITATCPYALPDCCAAVSASGSFYVDSSEAGVFGGNLPTGHPIPAGLPGGEHTGELRATLTNHVTGETRELDVQTRIRQFYVDDTPPLIELSHPQNDVVISSADLSVAGAITDAGSKLRDVRVEFSAYNCSFRRTPEEDPAPSIR